MRLQLLLRVPRAASASINQHAFYGGIVYNTSFYRVPWYQVPLVVTYDDTSMQIFQIQIGITGRTVHYWLFSSLRPEKENDFEFDENKANLARFSYFCLLLLSFASGRLPIALVIATFFFQPFASF